MANFKAQIESLSGATTDSEINQWMDDGAKEIINILPLKLKQKCSKVTNLYIGNTNTTMDLDTVGEILYVTRENANSGYYIGCREISPLLADSANDSSSLHYVTATDPVYWTESNSSGNPTLFVLPTPTANQPAKIIHISYPNITASDVSIIDNFPDEAEYLVVLYTAIKVLQNKMNEKDTSLPGDIPSITLATISTSLPSYTSVDSFVSVSSPIAPTMSAKTVTLNGTVPTYLQPVISLSEAPTVETLSITSALPVPPSIDLNTVTITGTAPTYTQQVVAPDFADANTWLNTEEDSEMVALNTFNKQQVEYQATLQKDIQDGQLAEKEEGRKLQKYATDLQVYQGDVNTQVQQYTANFQKDLQIWQAKRQTDLQKYGSDIQNSLNTFNKENTEYQANIQKDLQDANLSESKEGRDLQKYSQEISLYQAQVQTNVQKFQSDLADNTADFTNNIQKYTSEVQKISEVNQSNLARYTQDLANYGAKIQKHSVDYQWYQSQQSKLQKDYDTGVTILMDKGNTGQQQEQQERRR